MIPLTRPTLPKASSLFKKIENIFASGMLTNARYVSELEKSCAGFLGVRHVVAVNTGTAALLLSMKAMDLHGEVIIPSFTFTSDGHAVLWCGLEPVFVDSDPATFNIDVRRIEEKITRRTVAIMPTHVFGNPCDIEAIERIAKKHKLKVIYDAAHAFGSTYHNRSIATFGDISCFSLTPTKVLVAGEGGLIATNNTELAKKLVLGRNNGDSFDRSEEFLGLSARMSELSAIVALGSLHALPKNLKRRGNLVALYQKKLKGVPGIGFQKITPHAVSVYKDFAITINESEYGRTRDELLQHLLQSGVGAKVYFDPPLHGKVVYKKYNKIKLPNTDRISAHIMDLPLYSHMPINEVLKVCSIVEKFGKK